MSKNDKVNKIIGLYDRINLGIFRLKFDKKPNFWYNVVKLWGY